MKSKYELLKISKKEATQIVRGKNYELVCDSEYYDFKTIYWNNITGELITLYDNNQRKSIFCKLKKSGV